MQTLDLVILVLIGLGALVVSVGNLWLLVVAFMTGVGWGLLVFFVPVIGSLVFIISRWKNAKTAFQVIFLGFILMVAGVVVGIRYLGSQALQERLETWAAEAQERELVPAVINLGGEPARTDSHELNSTNFVGKTLAVIESELGEPLAIMEHDGVTFYLYATPPVELTSYDGITVGAQAKWEVTDVPEQDSRGRRRRR